jgi:hypothetical protein
MKTAERYHATPAGNSVLVRGRWFEGPNALGRALDWSRRAATASRVPLVVWRVCTAGPVRLKLVRRIEPAPLPA